MSTTIRLDVQVNKASAVAGIQDVEKELGKLVAAPATVNINVKGASAAANTLAKIALEEEKTNRERIKQEGLTARALEKTTQEELKNARAAQQVASANQEAATASNIFAVALGNIAARGFHMVVSKITQGIREAVTEMKEVDTQLTNISKVSGITGQALADMGERAYETASKYGVAADEYLSAVYTFQKAGLGESAEAMGELAVKTMLVGDTTADVASQFLISANAAWKFGGNIEDLNRIVDEADYINNNYATDLTKLSQGLPRVASVAAQAGMSAEETLAAIGTITAVTQESGTKAATALRALILNIEGQIGEFVDETGESFTVTEESVKSMQGLMEKYAKAELDAAKASGELINPMTAIKAIFEGMANSDLNNQELFQLLSGMGGKLRTNQLTALVQNYELFDDMLGKIADSAGTADSEISLMMESWERKTQVLKNTWTEFIADFVDTDTIKGSIDVLTEAISGLDDLLFKTGSERTKSKYTDLAEEYDSLLSKGAALTAQEEARLEWLEKQTDALKEQAAIQANFEARNSGRQQVGTNADGTPLYYEDAMYESLTAGWQNAGQQLSEGSINADEYLARMREVVQANRDYYDSLMQWKDAGATLSDTQENFIRDFEYADNVIKATSVDLRDAGDGYQYIVDQQGNVIAKIKSYEQVQKEATQREQERQQAQEDAERAYEESVREQAEAFEHAQQSIERAKTGSDDLTTSETEASTAASNIASGVAGIDFSSAITGAKQLARTLLGISIPSLPGRAGGTANAEGGPTLVNELGPELISENGKAYIANGGRPTVVNLTRGAIVLPANVTKDALRGGPIRTINAAADGVLGDPGYTAPYKPESDRTRPDDPGLGNREPEVPTNYKHDWTCPKCGAVNVGERTTCYKCGTKKRGTGGKGGGGGGGGGGKQSKKKQADDAAKKLNDKLSNIDKRAQLAHTEERYSDEQSLYKRAISLIEAQIKKYRKAGYKEKSNEIVDLKNKKYSYQDKIDSVEKAKWDAEIKRRQAEHDAKEREDEMAKRQKALADAQTALENAQNQRNVRIYNAATGQWEWVADQKAIQSAQDKLASAQDAYDEAIYNQEIEDLKSRRDAGEKYKGTKAPTAKTATIKSFIEQLGAVYGDAPFSTKLSSERVAMSGGDSHDTVYNFGNITLSEAEANSTSVAELARRLNVLKIS